MKRVYFITNNERIVNITTDEAKARSAAENMYDVYQADVDNNRFQEIRSLIHSFKNIFKFGCAVGIRYRKVA